jgi:uncharacterized protein YndB with AHSA1/START domain
MVGGREMAEKVLPAISATPGGREIIITTAYKASRQNVWRAYTEPELIKQWWGPRYLTTEIDKMDVREGGMWRFVQKDRDGNEYGFHGVFHELSRPERIVQTWEWEGMPGHPHLEIAHFEEKNGMTIVKAIAVFETVEDRDGMMASGMKQGVDEGAERLSELLDRMESGSEPMVATKVGSAEAK